MLVKRNGRRVPSSKARRLIKQAEHEHVDVLVVTEAHVVNNATIPENWITSGRHTYKRGVLIIIITDRVQFVSAEISPIKDCILKVNLKATTSLARLCVVFAPSSSSYFGLRSRTTPSES
jgi:hypothetical protein